MSQGLQQLVSGYTKRNRKNTGAESSFGLDNTTTSKGRNQSNSLKYNPVTPNSKSNQITLQPQLGQKKTKNQIAEEQFQTIQELKKVEKKYYELQTDIIDTYQYVNELIQSGDNEEIKQFQKQNFDIQYKEKSMKVLLGHIQSLVQVFIKNTTETSNLLEQAKIKIDDKSGIQDYIFLLQKAEAENRQNIREKQQLKLSLESYQEKLKNSEQQNILLAEYSQTEMKDLLKEYYKKVDALKGSEGEIDELNEMIRKQKKSNESLEERCLSIIILENKCKKLGIKASEDMSRLKQEFSHQQEMISRQNRETMRKDRTVLDQKNTQLQNQIQFQSQLNKSLKSENINRIQQLNDIIEEKEQQLRIAVEKLQKTQEALAEKNRELFYLKNMKEDYGNPNAVYGTHKQKQP